MNVYNMHMEHDCDNFRESILEQNRILYCMRNRPCTETAMCWGLDVPDTWLDEIDRMSKKLEAINILVYPKHRVRIQMDQVKSKYGELRAYFSIIVDPNAAICLYEKAARWLISRLGKLDFKLETIVDKPAWTEVKTETIKSKEEFDEKVKQYKRCTNVKIYAKDGQYIKETTLEHLPTVHVEATKHKLAYSVYSKMDRIVRALRHLLHWRASRQQECIIELLQSATDSIIEESVDRCAHVCECCGAPISDGNSYSPRCTTFGWISYLCKSCAAKSKRRYACNGEILEGGKTVVSREELAARNREDIAS